MQGIAGNPVTSAPVSFATLMQGAVQSKINTLRNENVFLTNRINYLRQFTLNSQHPTAELSSPQEEEGAARTRIYTRDKENSTICHDEAVARLKIVKKELFDLEKAASR